MLIFLMSLPPLFAIIMVAVESFVPIGTFKALVYFFDHQKLDAGGTPELSFVGLRMSYVPLNFRLAHERGARFP
ncbi:hypothetical protein [Methyloglobulus sp.]|uniref:hypothetical protein n=1 Tax=Methyloglobulus sp. TaxID=2518622 RepID=UPI00185875E8|nr:hypothetical protein [Methyloglobulus sp.]